MPRDIRDLTDEELLSLIGNRPQSMSPGEAVSDIGAGAARGAATVASGIAGIPGDVQAGSKWLAGKIGGPLTETVAAGVNTMPLPTSTDVRGAIERWTGPLPPPKSAAGKGVETLTEFVPGALMPGGVARRVANVVFPAAGAEVGEAVGGNAGRAVGTLAGGLVGARGTSRPPARPEYQAAVDILEREGVPMTAGQRTGSKMLKRLEDVAAMSFGSSGRGEVLNEATGRGFSGAVMRRLGASGQEIATPDAVNRAVQSLDDRFNQLSARNTLQADQQMGQDLIAVARQYASTVPETQRAGGTRNIGAIIDDIVAQVGTNNGTISGEMYQAMRSRFDKMAKGVQQSDPQLSEAIRGIRNTLDDTMERSLSPADRAAWREARAQWGNWKDLTRAISGAGSETAQGFVSPSQLRSSVASYDRPGYARGRGGDMSDLARAGETVLKPLPTSGTAERAMLAATLAGAGGAVTGASTGGDPLQMAAGALAPGIFGRMLLSRPGQAIAGNRLMPSTNAEMRRQLLVQQLLAERTRE